MKQFCIKIASDEALLEKVLTALFSKGYVFGPIERYRRWNEVSTYCRTQFGRFDWVLIGYDDECSKVLVIGNGDWSKMDRFRTVFLEEFLGFIEQGMEL